jgi:patatin-like phospholipase/acyl hydrolase
MAGQRLLAIDGGGVRGIIPLCQLVELERVTGALTKETFTFVAGTSVGAIIAGGIAAGIPATELLDRFIAMVGDVFTQRPWNQLVRLIAGHMYSTPHLNSVLRTALGSAGDWTMNDSPINLLVTAVRVTDGRPWYFVKDNQRNRRRTGQLSLADCVTASASAPTYFAPWTIPKDPVLNAGHHPIGTLVDGGVSVTGNPVYQACVEAFDYTEGYRPEETIVVSLGTGSFLDRRPPTWLGSWLSWLLAEMLRSPSEQQTDIVCRHFPQTPCYRINPQLPEDIPLDKTAQLDLLRDLGTQFAAKVDWAAILAGGPSPYACQRPGSR